MQLIWFCLQLALTLHPNNIYIINMVDGFALLATTLKNAKIIWDTYLHLNRCLKDTPTKWRIRYLTPSLTNFWLTILNQKWLVKRW